MPGHHLAPSTASLLLLCYLLGGQDGSGVFSDAVYLFTESILQMSIALSEPQ